MFATREQNRSLCRETSHQTNSLTRATFWGAKPIRGNEGDVRRDPSQFVQDKSPYSLQRIACTVGTALSDPGCPDGWWTSGPAPWMRYQDAADYIGVSVGHLRNLVSAGQIPVYGPVRVRRFRRDMLDLYVTDPDAAMRKFRLERKRTRDG